MRKLLINLFLLCTGKDGIAMMAMLWAQEIMNQETVEDELDITEYYCRPYADVDDVDDV